MVRKKQHNDGLVDGNIHSKKRPSTTKFQYPTIPHKKVLVNRKKKNKVLTHRKSNGNMCVSTEIKKKNELIIRQKGEKQYEKRKRPVC